MIRSICAWQPLLTSHYAHTLAAAAEAAGAELLCISDRGDDAVRRGQGWTFDALPLTPELLPKRGWHARIKQIFDEDPGRIHIFASPFERSRINVAMVTALWRQRATFLISEPYCPKAVGYLTTVPSASDRLKAAIRPPLYSVYGALLRGRVSGLFAISPAAVRQFRGIGVPSSRIFPFGYFVPQLSSAETTRPPGVRLRIAYLGSFIARKGVDTLIAAVRDQRLAGALEVDLYGPSSRSGPAHAEGVVFKGPLPFGQVQQALAGYDVLVVPSLFDGWAVVVNEAVLAGTPVVASDAVGAGAMLSKWNCGTTFAAGCSQSLANVLASLVAEPARLAVWRSHTAALAAQLQPTAAGAYMAACMTSALEHRAAPAAPWFDV